MKYLPVEFGPFGVEAGTPAQTNKTVHLTNLHSVLYVLLFKLSLHVKLQRVVEYKTLWYVDSLDFSLKT